MLAPPPPLREAPRSPHSPGGRSMAEKLAAGHMLTDDELAAMQEYSAVTAEFENGSLPLVPMMPTGPRTSTPRSLACAQAGEMSRASTSQSARCVGLGEQSRASTSQSARCVGTGATAAWPSPRGGNPYTAHLSPEIARAYEPSPPQQPRRAMTSQSARYVGTGGRNSRSTLSLHASPSSREARAYMPDEFKQTRLLRWRNNELEAELRRVIGMLAQGGAASERQKEKMLEAERVARKAHESLLQEQIGRVDELRSQIDSAEQVAKQREKAALERLRKELAGTAEEQAAAKAEAERERRVEELCGKAAKRMGNQGILRGWTAWVELYEELAAQRQMLASAGARLLRPKLAASFTAWRADYGAAAAAKTATGAKARLAKVEAELEAVAAELRRERDEGKKRMLAAAAHEAAALDRLRKELAGTAEEQAAAKADAERAQRVDLAQGGEADPEPGHPPRLVGVGELRGAGGAAADVGGARGCCGQSSPRCVARSGEPSPGEGARGLDEAAAARQGEARVGSGAACRKRSMRARVSLERASRGAAARGRGAASARRSESARPAREAGRGVRLADRRCA